MLVQALRTCPGITRWPTLSVRTRVDTGTRSILQQLPGIIDDKDYRYVETDVNFVRASFVKELPINVGGMTLY